MSIVRDVLFGLVRPKQVLSRRLAHPIREHQSILWLMLGCLLACISTLPKIARDAHINGEEASSALAAAGLAWLMIAPLLFIFLAALLGFGLRLFHIRLREGVARAAFFWAFLGASPLLLLFGLLRGLNGADAGAQIIGFLWVLAFMRLLLLGLREIRGNAGEDKHAS